MSLEMQTIGFIVKCFKDVLDMKQQQYICGYRVDLLIRQQNIIVECDENGHNDRDRLYEAAREYCLKKQGYTIIRFNPNEPDFCLADVINKISNIVFPK
jgi:very-short-patch-repair endonuclease